MNFLRPFSGEHVTPFDDIFKVNSIKKVESVYSCVVCDQSLFSSNTKFESGSGWPSFYDVLNSDSVYLIEDKSYGLNYFIQRSADLYNLMSSKMKLTCSY